MVGTPEHKALLRAQLRLTDRTKEVWAKAKALEIKSQAENELFVNGEILDDTWSGWFGRNEATWPAALREELAQIEGDVTVRLNSPGGDVFAGAAIYQLLSDRREDGDKVTVRVDGLAASAAIFPLMAGNEVVMGRLSMAMIHRAWAYTVGNADELQAQVNLLRKLDDQQADLLSDRLTGSEEEIVALLAAETWFTAKEAVDAGLADAVGSPEPAEAEESKEGEASGRLSLTDIIALRSDAARTIFALQEETQ